MIVAALLLAGCISASPANLPAFHPDSAAVVAVAARFHAALASGDSTTALALLDRDLIVLESGGAETRDEYRSQHLPDDIKFVQSVKSDKSLVGVVVNENTAWVASTTITRGTFAGRQINSDGAELIVLRKGESGWKIAAIHWSSRARRPAAADK